MIVYHYVRLRYLKKNCNIRYYKSQFVSLPLLLIRVDLPTTGQSELVF